MPRPSTAVRKSFKDTMYHFHFFYFKTKYVQGLSFYVIIEEMRIEGETTDGIYTFACPYRIQPA
mgnify:CR=1 FL=1